MTEKQLAKRWWWHGDGWRKIMSSVGGVDASLDQQWAEEIIRSLYERAAFNYEATLRHQGAIHSRPFCDLSSAELMRWKDYYPTQAYDNGGGILYSRDEADSDDTVSLSNIRIRPGETTLGICVKVLAEEIERRVTKKGLRWAGKTPTARKKAWPWEHLEITDRLANGVDYKGVIIHPERTAKMTLCKYGKSPLFRGK